MSLLILQYLENCKYIFLNGFFVFELNLNSLKNIERLNKKCNYIF